MTRRTSTTVFLVLIIVAAGILWYSYMRDSDDVETQAPTQTNQTEENQTTNTPEPFDKSALPTNDPSSIWVVVNKQNPLDPINYVPDDLVYPDVRLRVPGNESMQLRQEAADAVERMFASAQSNGLSLMLSSGYRSYAYQQNLYGSYVQSQGQATADTQSARPGHSEHQTGLAVDIRPTNGECELEICFGEMAEGGWLAENAANYGFILRYTSSNESEAGYSYEPWHFRYVGVELAKEYVRANASSLEAYFDLPLAPNYN